jgi:isopenicillin N synthase-like dioxygenase
VFLIQMTDQLEIPVIDLSLRGTDREPEILKELHRALFDVGFFQLKNGPLTESIIDAAISQAHAFFSLPDEVKATVDCRKSPQFRGWMPQGGERTMWKVNRRENYDAGFHKPVCTDPDAPVWKKILTGPNVWPPEEMLPGFRSALETYWDMCYETFLIANKLMLKVLKLPEDYLDDHFLKHEPFLFAKLAYYPPLTPGEEVDEHADFIQGIGPHRDASSWITLVAQDGPGLQAQKWDGTWIDVPVLPGHIAVNLAIPFDRFTHGRCPATTHRVNTRLITKPRVSLPYFLSPSFETQITPLDESKLPAERNPLALEAVSDSLAGWTGQDLANDGERWLLNRTRQYRSVAEKFWPDLIERFGIEAT